MVPKMLENVEPNEDSNENLLTFIYSILLLDTKALVITVPIVQFVTKARLMPTDNLRQSDQMQFLAWKHR